MIDFNQTSVFYNNLQQEPIVTVSNCLEMCHSYIKTNHIQSAIIILMLILIIALRLKKK